MRASVILVLAIGCARIVEEPRTQSAETALPDAALGSVDTAAPMDCAATDVDIDGSLVETSTSTDADTSLDAAPLDAADSTPSAELIATMSMPRAIAVRGDEVFVTSIGSAPAIYRLPKGGGALTKIEGGTRPTYVSVDATHVYWSDISNGSEPRTGAIRRAPLLGGVTETLARDLQQPNSVALTAGEVYFAQGIMGPEVQVLLMAKTGGTPKTIASPGYWSAYVAVNSTKVCWVRKVVSDPAIQCAPLGGGAAVTIASENASALSIDEADAFFLADGSIKRVSLAGGAVTTIAAGLKCGSAIVLDGTYAYETCISGVIRVPKAGGIATTLSTALKDDFGWAGIAVDATHVYWTSPADDAVRRIAK